MPLKFPRELTTSAPSLHLRYVTCELYSELPLHYLFS